MEWEVAGSTRDPAASASVFQPLCTIPPIVDGARFLVFHTAEPGAPTPTAAVVTAHTPTGQYTVRLTVRPQDYIQGESIHKLAARNAIRDLEDGTHAMSLEGFVKLLF